MLRPSIPRASSRSALLCALVLAACDPGTDLGRRCEYNSDCPEEQSCVNGICGNECRVHRDCPLESECLISPETGLGRCRLPEERCEQCTGGLVCGADDRCHSPCGELCPADGACIEGACVRVSGDAGTPSDARAPSDAGATFAHQPCATSATCGAGRECVSFEGAESVCRAPCTTIEECGADATCLQLGSPGTSTDYCSIPCDPVTSAGCPVEDACDYVEALSGVLERADASMVRPRAWDCRSRTDAAPGASCVDMEDCGAGQTCAYDGTTVGGEEVRVCVRHCYRNAAPGAIGSCPDGMRCNAWGAPSPVSDDIGYCRFL